MVRCLRRRYNRDRLADSSEWEVCVGRSSMTRRALVQTLMGGSLLAQFRQSSRRPNLIVILADDLGCGDIGCFGGADVSTPWIDGMAQVGAQFTDAYVSAPVCSPSRASLLTGRYQQRFGFEFNPGSAAREAEIGFGLPASERILPYFLSPAGYKCAIIGKWHLGVRPGYHPLDRGFDEFFGFLGGANDYVITNTPGARVLDHGWRNTLSSAPFEPIYRGRQAVTEERYLTDAFAREAVDFIERNRKAPFFLYLALNAVHEPFHGTDRYWDRFPGIMDERRRMLASMASAMDDAVGAVVKTVRDCGLEQDTMIIFMSDNGAPIISGCGSNGPFNGEKCTFYEGGIRVPFLAVWPGRIPAGKTYRQPIVSRDIAPTLLAAAGIRKPGVPAFDGVDLLPFLNGGSAMEPHDVLCWRAGTGRAIRKGKWKLIEVGEAYTRLYDLAKDPGEKTDLSKEATDVVAELRAAWRAWSARMSKPAWPARHRDITVNGEQLTWEL